MKQFSLRTLSGFGDTAVKRVRMRNLLNFRSGIRDAPTLSNRTISLGLGVGVGAQNALLSDRSIAHSPFALTFPRTS